VARVTGAPVRLVLAEPASTALLELMRPGAWLDADRAIHIEVERDESVRSVVVLTVRQYGRAASNARQRPAAPACTPMTEAQAAVWARVSALAAIEPQLDVWCVELVVTLGRVSLDRPWGTWVATVRGI
jgi:hypothetical protein